MLFVLGVHPLGGSARRCTTVALLPLAHSSIRRTNGNQSGCVHTTAAAKLRVWLALASRSFSSAATTKATSNVAPAATVAQGAPRSPVSAAPSAAATSPATGAALGNLSASAAAVLGAIKSAYEQMCKKSVSLNLHVHHQGIKTQLPKPKAAAATAARLTAAASRAAAAPVAPAASAPGRGDTAAATGRRSVKQLTRAERRSFEGHLRRFQLMGDKSEFHHVDRNKNQRIFEPYHMFSLSITTSKNNVHCVVRNNSCNKRTVFTSFAGKP